MTDKELLEMAAKAAGMQIFIWGKKGSENFCIKLEDGSPGNRWNPLTDDGDALRLMVKLGLNVNVIREDGTFVSRYETEPVIAEKRCQDPYAATRRAIVRAAAAIGKTK